MTKDHSEIYAILAKIIATKENEKYPEGEKHAVLAFAKATNHDEAESVAVKQLAALGWSNLEVGQIGTVDAVRKEGDDQRDKAINTALDEGFGAVIYQGVES